jgi:hypothetical protein
MKLSKVQVGRVVFHENYGVGCILGLTNNAPYFDEKIRREVDRVVISVEWASGITTHVHPTQLEYYKD